MNAKTIAGGVVAGLLTLWLWEKFKPQPAANQAPGVVTNTGESWFPWF